MTRTLSDVIYSEGNIVSGRCTGCGRLFTTPDVALPASEETELELVGAFGGHECTPAVGKPAA
jgi:hypothetical protein